MSIETDWAWLAGLVDGDGSIYMTRRTTPYNRDTLTPCLSVTNCHFGAIKKCHDLAQAGKFFVMSEPWLKKRPNKVNARPHVRWQVTSAAAVRVLRQIEPYLVIKREQALLAIHAGELNAEHKTLRKAVHIEKLRVIKTKISDLNHKVHEIPEKPKAAMRGNA